MGALGTRADRMDGRTSTPIVQGWVARRVTAHVPSIARSMSSLNAHAEMLHIYHEAPKAFAYGLVLSTA